MKRALSAIAALSLLFTGCGKDPVAVTGVTLQPTTLTLVAGGDTGTLVATVVPDNAGNKTVLWSTDKSTIATVAAGIVTPVAEGTATITATTADGGHIATCTVTVQRQTFPVTGVTLDQSTLSMVPGDEQTLVATVAPDNADNKTVIWSVDFDEIATVTQDGLVTAISPGTAIVTVTTEDQEKTASCTVTVDAIPVSSITLNKNTLTLVEGREETLTATVLPENATNPALVWSSSAPTKATVDQTGKVTAVAAGNATITATAADGSDVKDECTLTVEAAVVTPPMAQSTKSWVVGNQLWSDAINDPACDKTTYTGGSYNSPLSDGRSNPTAGYGHLYSWPYVQEHAATLCPAPWRVPTQQDFADLDQALGGTGEDQNSTAQVAKYISDWGGQYGGYYSTFADGQGTMAYYWSSTSLSIGAGGSLNFMENGVVSPKKRSGKEQAYMLRCVQDK